jgi:hypothetical protein
MSPRQTKASSDNHRSSSGSNLISWARSDELSRDSSVPSYLKDSTTDPQTRMMAFIAPPSQSSSQGDGNGNNVASKPQQSAAAITSTQQNMAPANTSQKRDQPQHAQAGRGVAQPRALNARAAPFRPGANNPAPADGGVCQGPMPQNTFATGPQALPMQTSKTHYRL